MPFTKTKRTSKKLMEFASQIVVNQNPEQSRINIRLPANIKERVARAATLTGQDLTEFAVATLSEKADMVIERHARMLLGNDEHQFFLDA